MRAARAVAAQPLRATRTPAVARVWLAPAAVRTRAATRARATPWLRPGRALPRVPQPRAAGVARLETLRIRPVRRQCYSFSSRSRFAAGKEPIARDASQLGVSDASQQ